MEYLEVHCSQVKRGSGKKPSQTERSVRLENSENDLRELSPRSSRDEFSPWISETMTQDTLDDYIMIK